MPWIDAVILKVTTVDELREDGTKKKYKREEKLSGISYLICTVLAQFTRSSNVPTIPAQHFLSLQVLFTARSYRLFNIVQIRSFVKVT